ncbi:unnamed protein product [Eruca vesicaria subsp. sativa]|uniref:Protein kinase domain-containing protein n=1 Tax=Eruca vesicaria subsp. sativa TaxID=29727 RepID=A0ABC8LYP2_ERUVS|nr:unnamed protein product [Eruca vesicaria subsp. sativa]
MLCYSNSSDQEQILFLPSIKQQVTNFDLGNFFSISVYNKFYIRSQLKHSGCYIGDADSSLNLTGSPFFITESNLFTAVGCNNKASMNATGLQILGCEATCGTKIRPYKDANKRCIGYKCCQMTIPPDLQVFDATVDKLEPGKEGCQVAFLTQSTLFTPPELSEYNNYTTVKSLTYNAGGTLSSGLFLRVIGMWLLCKANRKRKAAKQKRKFFKRNGGLLLQQQTHFLQGSVNRTKLFSSGDLEKATDKFNASRILGQGGQGTVYKGMLEDGMIVAVKKSKALEEENLEEFINEIILLSQINHRNVVKILGCCLETEVPMLVYEFIPNRNLFDHLHNPSEDFPMTWGVRLRIAWEVADALSYLHSAASIPIYHRDVKSTNILLDEKHRAKVSDFGISRSVPLDDTHLTTVVQGTVGYVDPEYLQSNHFTGKSDVYSFGVVLIELVTGGKPVSLLRPQEVRMLGAYFLEAMRNDRLHDILDARIKEECDQEEVLAVAKLAQRCLSLNSEHRPTMRDVFIELDRMQSKGKSTQIQTQNGEEHDQIRIAIPESMSLSYTSPDIVVENSSFSLYSKPLMPHKTQ